jgi:hypothetical protein
LAEPIHIGGVGGQGFVLTADEVPDPLNGIGHIHNGCDFGRAGGTKAVQGGVLIYEPAALGLRSHAVDYEKLGTFAFLKWSVSLYEPAV